MSSPPPLPPPISAEPKTNQPQFDFKQPTDLKTALAAADRLSRRSDNVPRTVARRFIGDARPQKDRDYFLSDGSTPRNDLDVAVIVPFYNETATELQRSLVSLARQQTDVAAFGGTMRVLLVADGWPQADRSMKNYLKQLFPGGWTESLDKPPLATDGPIETVVVQRAFVDDGRCCLDAVRIAPDCWLQVTLLVKRDNRKKHNSHNWSVFAFDFDVVSSNRFFCPK
jgi:cellulose synthase/poly-beta-1,6-N-acetylglucosamine synthase-like glycosyltransferase